MDFPLLDNIITEIENKNLDNNSLTVNEKQDLIENIKKFDDDGHELIYALIKIFNIKYDSTTSISLPYNGKSLKKGIKFDIDTLPNKLQQVLFQFQKIHLQKINHEKTLREAQEKL